MKPCMWCGVATSDRDGECARCHDPRCRSCGNVAPLIWPECVCQKCEDALDAQGAA